MDENKFLRRKKGILSEEDRLLKEKEDKLKEQLSTEESNRKENAISDSVEDEEKDESSDGDTSEDKEENENEKEEGGEKEKSDGKNPEEDSQLESQLKDSNERKKLANTNSEGNSSENKVKKEKREEGGEGGESQSNGAGNELKDSLKDKIPGAEKLNKAQQVYNNVLNRAKMALNALGIIGKVLVNPVFWIIVGVVLLVSILFSAFSIIGGNDYNQSCDYNGVGSVNVAEDADDFTRQSAIASWLMSTPFEVLGGKPMSREQAMGVMGNLMKESYGANPKAIQGDHSLTKWQTCDNDCVASFVGGGKAVGILQWDGNAGDTRRMNLVQLARAEGKQWYDLSVQLKHIKNELDGIGSHTYENYQIKRSGFLDPGKSIDEYTEIWAKYIERCGTCRMDDRIESANSFNQAFQGGGSIAGGSISTQCVGAGNIDSSSLVQLALQISYSREEKASGLGYGVCAKLNNCGDKFSKPEYITAKEMAEQQTGVDPFSGLTASCDRMAATLYRLTGIDVNFPWGGASAQLAYVRSNPGWRLVSCQERQPGDAIIRPGHIMVYIGEVDGKDSIASASIALASRVGPNGKGRAAHIGEVSCKGSLFYADGGTAEGFRKVD